MIGFPNLIHLDVSHNEIKELGTALPPKLESLDLSHNQLMELPDKQLELCKRCEKVKCGGG